MAVVVSQVLSHWAHYFPYSTLSSNTLYSKVEELVKSHEMPHTKTERVTHKEGGMFSASREYFRIKYKDLVFDVCAAPFGKDFFVSWWLYESEGAMKSLLKFTKAGEFLAERAAKRTFFEADEESIFRSCVHDCVLEAIDKLTEGQGQRLTELEKQIKEGGM
jgi:hypothetical protein